MRRGSTLIGWGMAGGAWESMQQKAAASARLTVDGKLTVASATEDIGTGTYTVMTQIAAEMLGLPLEDVTFKLGDSSLPEAPVEGGSFTVASVGSAVKAACEKVGKTLFELARKVEGSPLAKASLDDVEFADGQIRLRDDPSRSVSIAEAMRARRGRRHRGGGLRRARGRTGTRGTRTRRSSPRWRSTRTSARSASRGS